MIRKQEFSRLDRLLRKEKRVFDVAFGGVHILLTGDFLQLPPVGASPLFADPKAKRKWSSIDIAAYELWRTFWTVIILEESVRFRSDPEWGNGCKAAGLGNWTPKILEMINSRVVPKNAGDETTLNIGALTGRQTVFASPEHATRAAINSQFIVSTSTMMTGGSYPIRGVASFKGALRHFGRNEAEYILNLPDSRFGRMAPFLDLIPGMPIQVTKNVRPTKGVASGSFGILLDVRFKPSTTFRIIRDTTSGMPVRIPSEPPLVAFVRVNRGPGAIAISPTISPDIFPLFYTTEGYSKCKIQLAPAPNGVPRWLETKIQQFPFVCAVGSTAYKVQGETLNSVVVVAWRSSVAIANKPQQNYLLVSRATSRNALLALEPFTSDIAEWSKPPQDAVDEEKSLLVLSETTLKEFHAEWQNGAL